VGFPRRPGLRIHFRTKQHQKRASEAQNSQPIIIDEVVNPDESVVFSDSVIEELVEKIENHV